MKRIIQIMLLVLSALFLLAGCYYNPDWPPAQTQAINSVLGVLKPHGPDQDIILAEEDNFGRKMYLYIAKASTAYQKTNEGAEFVMALLIEQKSDNKCVYYYPDISFIVREMSQSAKDAGFGHEQLLNSVREIISEAEIEALKSDNDWNKPMDESKLIKTRFPKRNQFRSVLEKSVPKRVRRKVYDEMSGHNDSIHKDSIMEGFYDYLTVDDYGRHICFFRTQDENRTFTNSYVVMFKPGGSYEIAEIFDLWNYQGELKTFKEQNDWNKPIK